MTQSQWKQCRHGIALMTMILAVPVSAQETARTERFPRGLEAYITKAVAEWEVPGLAIAVVRNDSTLVARGWGVRELGRADAVDENTIFDIASLTKSFTATAAAILVDRGRLGWDDPIRRHLPGLVLPTDSLTATATIRDFLSHGTGLDPANMMWVLTAVDRAEVLGRMRHLAVRVPMRQSMVYSNVGYTVAGEAIAAAAAKPFEAAVKDLIIAPLGLTSTTASYDEAASRSNIASSHAFVGGRLQPIRRETQRHAVAPAASVQSSAHDLTRWMRLHLNNGTLDGTRYVSDSAMQAMHARQTLIPTTPAMRAARLVEDTVAGYGMGWQVMDYRGRPLLWHSGNGDGQIAWIALLPRERIGVAVLINTWSAPQLHGALVNRILDEYLGVAPRDWAAEARANVRPPVALDPAVHSAKGDPPRRLAEYEGRYDHAVFGPLFVRSEAGRLVLQMGEGQKANLDYQRDETFMVHWQDAFFREYYMTTVDFTGTSGITGLRMLLNRDQIIATKIR